MVGLSSPYNGNSARSSYSSIGPSSGPEILIFKRFRSAWPSIDQRKFSIVSSDPDALRYASNFASSNHLLLVRIQVNSAENEEVNLNLNESDRSSANGTTIGSRCGFQGRIIDDEEATACDLDSASSRDDIPITYCRAN
ncbi:hypothetical protein EVAR_38058_1 [Eumeta japonica]|uniref:Uncharacterized protein n=1 Tax=Eumeta variegata TaxID=151549 RepID=A0A4C1WAY0_EUMVA|nr:hypothetical protein EVAR_38058_1 [Eumeta japonica]